jgi:hypothetical protein
MLRTRFTRAASNGLTPVALFAGFVVSAAGAVPASATGSAMVLAGALTGLLTTFALLVAWVLHADWSARSKEAQSDPAHVVNWWPEFEHQFWAYVNAPSNDRRR